MSFGVLLTSLLSFLELAKLIVCYVVFFPQWLSLLAFYCCDLGDEKVYLA